MLMIIFKKVNLESFWLLLDKDLNTGKHFKELIQVVMEELILLNSKLLKV
jgi:hypothetical protein